MVEINWTIINYFVIGLFVLSGFYKGWWKEAFTTFLLGILVFFVRHPDIAEWVIEAVNGVISTVLQWLPADLQNTIVSILDLRTIADIRIDASSGQTWLVILILFLGLSILLTRNILPNRIMKPPYTTYPVTPLGAFLGGLLGGLNGFLIINLVREYLTGSFLPLSPATEIASVAGQTVGTASAGVDFLVTDLPRFTSLDTLAAWIVIGFGFLIALIAFKNAGTPPGYQKWKIQKKKEDKKEFNVGGPVVIERRTWFFW